MDFITPITTLRRIGAALALIALVAPGYAAVDSGHARAELISGVYTVAPGQSFDVALLLKLDRGWHTYWVNPGDSGLPARLDWTLPPGFRAGAIEWPVPQRIATPPFMTYGYHDRVALPLRIEVPRTLPAQRAVALRAQANYLVCREVCLPESADLELVLVTSEAPATPDPKGQAVIAAARARAPRALPQPAVSAVRAGDALYLEWAAAAPVRAAYFYPAEGGVLEHAAPQVLERTDTGQRLRLTPSTLAAAPVRELNGVLATEPGLGPGGMVAGLTVDTPVAARAAMAPGQPMPAAPGLAAALALAFVGGLILNLMPCVFPVLALKVVGLAGAAGGRARAMGLAYGGGVLVSVWALAGLLLALKAAGQAVGWGFQLQQPGFVAGMALLMTAVGLNLFGVYEVGGGLVARAGTLDRRGGLDGAGLSGALAVLLATPCTAPFMAGALGFALTRPPGDALAVFTALGLGLAAPFLLLAEVPGLAARLPRPGAWMLRLKQTLAFPMLAAALWLAWVYGRQRDLDGAALLLAALLAAAFGFYAYGLAQQRRSALAHLGAVAGFAGAALLLAAALRLEPGPPPAGTTAAGGLGWEAYSAGALAQHRAAGRPVFLDFTAAWCLTCKVNEAVALKDARVVARFAALGVVPMKADWTHYDPAITEALAGFGRSGVPVYVYYPPGRAGRLLPEILTPGRVLEALDETG